MHFLPTRNLLCKYLFCFGLFLCLDQTGYTQTYVFAQLNGSPLNTSGWNITGDARVRNVTGTGNSELLLCPAEQNSNGAVFFSQPINLSRCVSWIAEFDFRMYDGTGADGIAFCFLDVPPTGFVRGGGLGIPDNANGLKVCFDTWNNCIPFDTGTVHYDMPKIEIRWGVGYDDDSDPNNIIYGECRQGPTRDNSDGKLSYIRSPNYNHAKISYDSGLIKVYVNDTLYLQANNQFNFTGYMGITASTGGYTDNHSIKNLIIYTQMPPSVPGQARSFCPYDTVSLGGPSNPGYGYAWSPATGLNDTTLASPLLHLSNDSANAQSHTYYIRTSFLSRPGCSSLDSVTVTVYPNPKVNFVMPEICLTDAIAQFYDSSYTSDNASLPFTYQWNFGDPNAGPGNSNSSTGQNPAHHYSAAAHYNVGLAVTNSLGCADSASKVFTVNGAVPRAVFEVSNPGSLCSNRTVQITNSSTVDFGSIIRVEISWGDTVGNSYVDSFPYPGKTYSHQYPDPVTAQAATYELSMISSSGISCRNEIDQQITVQPSPHVLFSAISAVCDYAPPLTISQATELTGMNGSFSYSGRGISDAGLLNPAQAGPGIDTLQYTYAGTDGCRDSAVQTILVIAPPKVFAGDDTAVVINQPLQLQGQSSDSAGDTFLWSPSFGLNDSTISNPTALLGPGTDSIRYVLTVMDTAGCLGEASIEIKVFKTLPDIFVPNAFTPAKDIDNIFRPIPVGISSLRYFRIYNRVGQLVYSTTRLGDGWNGMLDGKLQDTGTYVWMVEGTSYLGKVISKKGTMVLIR